MSPNVWITACSRSRRRCSTSRRWQDRTTTRRAPSKGIAVLRYSFQSHLLTGALRLFYGKKKQRLTAFSPSDESRSRASIHEKEDLFSHLHVNVADEHFDLYDGLARYFDDVVELQGEKKRMEVTLVDLPPLLQIQLQVRSRTMFDRPELIKPSDPYSVSSSTVTPSRRTSRRRMWPSARPSIWTASSTAPTLKRRRGRRRSIWS